VNEIYDELCRQKKFVGKSFIVQKRNDKFVILDGNHRHRALWKYHAKKGIKKPILETKKQEDSKKAYLPLDSQS